MAIRMPFLCSIFLVSSSMFSEAAITSSWSMATHFLGLSLSWFALVFYDHDFA